MQIISLKRLNKEIIENVIFDFIYNQPSKRIIDQKYIKYEKSDRLKDESF